MAPTETDPAEEPLLQDQETGEEVGRTGARRSTIWDGFEHEEDTGGLLNEEEAGADGEDTIFKKAVEAEHLDGAAPTDPRAVMKQAGLCGLLISISVYEAILKSKAVKTAKFDFASLNIMQAMVSIVIGLGLTGFYKTQEHLTTDFPKQMLRYAPVGILFGAAAYTQFIALAYLDADVFKVLEQTRLLVLGLLGFFLLKKKLSTSSWVALCCITLCCLTYGRMKTLMGSTQSISVTIAGSLPHAVFLDEHFTVCAVSDADAEKVLSKHTGIKDFCADQAAATCAVEACVAKDAKKDAKKDKDKQCAAVTGSAEPDNLETACAKVKDCKYKSAAVCKDIVGASMLETSASSDVHGIVGTSMLETSATQSLEKIEATLVQPGAPVRLAPPPVATTLGADGQVEVLSDGSAGGAVSRRGPDPRATAALVQSDMEPSSTKAGTDTPRVLEKGEHHRIVVDESAGAAVLNYVPSSDELKEMSAALKNSITDVDSRMNGSGESKSGAMGYALTAVFVLLACSASIYSEVILHKDKHIPYYIQKVYQEISAGIFTVFLSGVIAPVLVDNDIAAKKLSVSFIKEGNLFFGWDSGLVIALFFFLLAKAWLSGLIVKQLSAIAKQLCSIFAVVMLYFFTLLHDCGEDGGFMCPSNLANASFNVIVVDFAVLCSVVSYTTALRDKQRKNMYKKRIGQLEVAQDKG